MRAGPLRHRVEVDQAVENQNETGEQEVTFQPFVTEWASVEPVRGQERLVSNQILASVDTKFTLRWSPTTDQIRPTWRIRHQGIKYNILAIIHVTMGRRTLEIMAKSGLDEGG